MKVTSPLRNNASSVTASNVHYLSEKVEAHRPRIVLWCCGKRDERAGFGRTSVFEEDRASEIRQTPEILDTRDGGIICYGLMFSKDRRMEQNRHIVLRVELDILPCGRISFSNEMVRHGYASLALDFWSRLAGCKMCGGCLKFLEGGGKNRYAADRCILRVDGRRS